MKQITAALIKARLDFSPIVKNKINPQFKSKYANLDSILDSIIVPLCNAGIALIQPTVIRDGGTILITKLIHESGESIESELILPNNLDPQKLGAALTYYRRFALCSILSIAADDDDDGNTASNSAAKSQYVAKPQYAPKAITAPLKSTLGTTPAIPSQYQADLKAAFEELKWDSTRKSGWAKTINPAPFAEWTDDNWKLALHRAYAEIEKTAEVSEMD
jgi:hypothetical protein